MRSIVATALLVMTTSVAFGQQSLTLVKARELGRKYTAALYANDTATLWSDMTDRMQESMKDEAALRQSNAMAALQIGKESKLFREVALPNREYLIYTRLAEFDKVQAKIVVQFTFDSGGKIAGFFVMPEQVAAPSQFLHYKDKTTFTLPFTGAWTIYQGGRDVFDNFHAASIDQRFAYDFMLIKGIHQYANKGEDLSDYYSFGLPVLAPAAGKVVAAVDQYDDNLPLHPSKDAPAHGNSIVIDHGNGEFSMLAHLKRGTLKVKAGDVVTAGQSLAECGNSGNSPIPHLHYHLQNTPLWFKGEGLPIQFHDYLSEGKPVAVGEPVRGDVLQRAEAPQRKEVQSRK